MNKISSFKNILFLSVSLKAFVISFLLVVAPLVLTGCASTYYSALEKAGIPKRELLVDRVVDTRDAQQEAQQQFQSALDQFGSVVKLEQTDLKTAYDRLDKEYKKSLSAAENVSTRIDKVESVSDALFAEWKKELKLYENAELKASSQAQLNATKSQYDVMLQGMHEAEKSMQPVLNIFRDNVLFLKHNLNAQAIGSLETEFDSLKLEISSLIQKMDDSINRSNKFIESLNSGS